MECKKTDKRRFGVENGGWLFHQNLGGPVGGHANNLLYRVALLFASPKSVGLFISLASTVVAVC